MSANNQELDAKALSLFEKSLNIDRSLRVNWIIEQAGSEQALRNKTLQILASDESEFDILQTGSAVADSHLDIAPPERVGAYKITERIGQGGMGAVYRAQRDIGDFEHAVAIKLIRPGIISDNLKDRFAHEQQVMAGFSHANIAHLHDGGTTDVGMPYIIMELIDGISITDWVKQNKVSQAKCLELFKTVCEAVSYAHQNLIVHRDLTPSNVLVTSDGIVKLIDFGISKPFDETSAVQDVTGSLASLSFTPGFAAPERSQGAAANTLSDIYSLGKLMEAILVGSIIQTGDQAGIQTGMSKDLLAIFSNAIALNPDDRYASVNRLIDDLNNYQAGYPVNARQGRTGYKIGKFIRRNRVTTALSSVVVIALVGGLILTTYLYQRAETARIEADSRFADVRDIANFMLFDLYDELEKIPGTTIPLSSIANKSRRYLNELNMDKRADIGLKLEAAVGYKRLSDVLGNPKNANLGNREESKVLLDNAYQQLKILSLENPENKEISRAFAKTAHSYSVLKYISEDDTIATRLYAGEAIVQLQKIINSGDFEVTDMVQIFAAAQQSASTYIWDGEGSTGIVEYQKIVNEIKIYLLKNPDNRLVLNQFASVQAELGETMSWHYDEVGGDQNEPLKYLNNAIKIYLDLLLNEPKQSKVRHSLALSYYRHAQILMGLENFEEVLMDLETAQSIMNVFSKLDKSDQRALRLQVSINTQMVQILGELKRFEEAIELGKRGHKRLLAAYEQDSEDQGRFREVTTSLFSQAKIFLLAGEKQMACKYFQSAADNFVSIDKRGNLSELDRKNLYRETLEHLSSCKQ